MQFSAGNLFLKQIQICDDREVALCRGNTLSTSETAEKPDGKVGFENITKYFLPILLFGFTSLLLNHVLHWSKVV